MPVPAPVPALPEQGLSAAAGVLSVARFEIVKPAAPLSRRPRGQGTRGGMTYMDPFSVCKHAFLWR
jgi:hypothetical protein